MFARMSGNLDLILPSFYLFRPFISTVYWYKTRYYWTSWIGIVDSWLIDDDTIGWIEEIDCFTTNFMNKMNWMELKIVPAGTARVPAGTLLVDYRGRVLRYEEEGINRQKKQKGGWCKIPNLKIDNTKKIQKSSHTKNQNQKKVKWTTFLILFK